jgi:hypothetical protein
MAISQPQKPENAKTQGQEQKPQAQEQKPEEKKEKKKKEKLPGDFSHEYTGKQVTIVLGAGNPQVLKCKVEKATRYWLKVTIGARTLYVNKAYVVSIEA